MVIIAPLVMNLLHGPAADQAGLPKLTLGRILTSRRPNAPGRYPPFALQSRQAKGMQEGHA
jgi:hypothetical protein